LTKAVVGSFNHTYLFPEKSFSPSILVSLSGSRLVSSVLMKEGANVVEVGVPVLEVDLRLVGRSPLGASVLEREEYDWWRLCEGPCEDVNDELNTADFGRAPTLLGLEDGEIALEKGLPRICATFCAIFPAQEGEYVDDIHAQLDVNKAIKSS
jgi:hypothetical protein